MTGWRPEPSSRQASDVVRPGDPRLGDRGNPVRDGRGHANRTIGVDREGDEVALVDPDQVDLDREGPLELGLVVDLEQHIQTDLVGQHGEVGELAVVEGGGDPPKASASVNTDRQAAPPAT